MDMKNSLQALKLTKKSFDKNDIDYWLEYGTLLGAYLHGKFFPWDNDVDVSVLDKDIIRFLKCRPDFATSRYEIYYVNGHYDIRMKKTKKHLICLLPHTMEDGKNYFIEFLPPLTYLIFALESSDYDTPDYDYETTVFVKIDLPLFLKELLVKVASKLKRKDILIRALWYIQLRFKIYKKKYITPEDTVFPLKTTDFYGLDFKIPNDSEPYLKQRFGEEWNIPKHKKKVVKRWRGKTPQEWLT